jgi:hypothetical protein
MPCKFFVFHRIDCKPCFLPNSHIGNLGFKDYSVIVAPMDGQLGEVNPRVGQYVAAGSQLLYHWKLVLLSQLPRPAPF